MIAYVLETFQSGDKFVEKLNLNQPFFWLFLKILAT